MYAFNYIDDSFSLNLVKWADITEKSKSFFKSFPFLKDPAFKKLTTLQQRFVMAYTLKDLRGFMLYDCYRFAKNDMSYDKMKAAISASSLQEHKNVKPFLEKINWMRVEAMGFTQERIVEEEAGIAYSDITEYLDEDGMIVDLKTLPPHIRRAIKSFEVIETEIPVKGGDPVIKRTHRVKLWDKGASLHRMQKVKGMHLENLHVRASQTNVNINADMKPKDAAKLYTQFLKGEE